MCIFTKIERLYGLKMCWNLMKMSWPTLSNECLGERRGSTISRKNVCWGWGAIKKGWGVWYWEEFKDLINVC